MSQSTTKTAHINKISIKIQTMILNI